MVATDPPHSLSRGGVVAELPAQDLDRARAFCRDRPGLEPVEERRGDLRYQCAAGEFHIFLSAGAASGASTRLGFEVDGNDPSKGSGERGAFFRDSEGNVVAIGRATP